MSNPNAPWKVSSTHPVLAENEVHIWRASLQPEQVVLSRLQQFLAPDEIRKASRFYFEKDRQRFIIARGVLRNIVSRYLNIPPNAVSFTYNVHGKPSLAFAFHEHYLHFNLSHSQDVACYAFTYARHVGIDVEFMRSDIHYEELARHSFSAHEQATLATLPSNLKRQAFFNCWTRKEAYIKAKGRGLSLPLDLFDVSLRPDEPAILLANREEPQEQTCWTLQEFLPAPDYAGAIAVEGKGWCERYWQWHN